MTAAQLDRAIQAAIQFIKMKQREHATRLGWEVGEYLFVNVYKSDVEYLRKRNPVKNDSLHDIAAQSGVPYGSLYTWTRAALVRRLLRDMGLETLLPTTLLGDLGQLADHMKAMRALAEWAERHRISRSRLLSIVRFWKKHLDEGSKLRDLVRGLEKHETRKKRKGRPPPLQPDEVRIVRLLELIHAWTTSTSLGPAQRKRVRKLMARIRKLLGTRRSKP